jgi:hypothetical protein
LQNGQEQLPSGDRQGRHDGGKLGFGGHACINVNRWSSEQAAGSLVTPAGATGGAEERSAEP